MKKRRLLSLMAALLVTANVMGAPVMQAEAAGCGNWEISSVGTPFCTDAKCGFLFLNPQTHYQRVYYKRTCVSNANKVRTEYKNERKKLGCC